MKRPGTRSFPFSLSDSTDAHKHTPALQHWVECIVFLVFILTAFKKDARPCHLCNKSISYHRQGKTTVRIHRTCTCFCLRKGRLNLSITILTSRNSIIILPVTIHSSSPTCSTTLQHPQEAERNLPLHREISGS